MVLRTQDGPGSQTDVTLSPEETETPDVSYNQGQLDKAVTDAVTAGRADVGRMKAEADRALIAAKGAMERLDRQQKQQEEAEISAAGDDNDALSAIRGRQRSRQLTSELEAAKTELDEANTRLKESDTKDAEAARAAIAEGVAVRLKVDSKTLAKMAKFTDGTVESIEEAAKTLPKVSQEPLDETRPPDSSRTRGGGPQSVTDIRTAFNTGRITNEQYAEQMKARGVLP